MMINGMYAKFGLAIAAGLLLIAVPQATGYLAASADVGSSMTLPVSIIAQVLVALALAIVCSAHALGSFKPILAASEFATKTMSASLFNTDFAVYNHRGEALATLMAGVKGTPWASEVQ
jgi:hypothetical protein